MAILLINNAQYTITLWHQGAIQDNSPIILASGQRTTVGYSVTIHSFSGPLNYLKATNTGYTDNHTYSWHPFADSDLNISNPSNGFASNTKICTFTLEAPHPTITLAYNANGGTGAPASVSAEPPLVTSVSSVKPTLSGYTFMGWSTASNSTTVDYVGGDTISVYTGTTLYAVWRAPLVKFYWWGNETADAQRFYKGAPVTMIRADRWNVFVRSIKALYDKTHSTALNVSDFASGHPFDHTDFNAARNAIYQCYYAHYQNIALMPHIVSEQGKGFIIYTWLFHGESSNGLSLKEALNRGIDMYNSGALYPKQK